MQHFIQLFFFRFLMFFFAQYFCVLKKSSTFAATSRRDGRVVECGGLENR